MSAADRRSLSVRRLSARSLSARSLGLARRALVAACLLGSGGALAEGGVLVYVSNVSVQEGAGVDGRALTSTLCSSLAKDARLEVMCAPDVEQVISFSSQLALLGRESPAVSQIEQRVERLRWVVHGRVVKLEKGGLTLELGVHDKHPSTDGVVVVPGERRARFAEPVQDGTGEKLLERASALASQAAEEMTRRSTAETTPPPPPELEPKPKK